MSTVSQPLIVVGVSGSPSSLTALRWAASQAARLHGRLQVIGVWTAQPRAPYAPQPALADAEQRRERVRRDLAAAIRAVFGAIAPDYVLSESIEGEPERALARKSAGADLLVLGSASARCPAGRSLGPVIRTCLSSAHCPVVVVGPECLPADPLAERRFADANS
jgi:nucleotide-binding universal stress UspA family protein